MRHDDAGEHADDQEYEQQDRQPDAPGQGTHHARGLAAVAHQPQQRDAEARHHRQQGADDQQFDERRSLHGDRRAVKRYTSIERILPGIAGVALAVLCAGLGLWQLQRADAARALAAAVSTQMRQAPLALAGAGLAGIDAAELNGRRVTAQGRWRDGLQILLDNQVAAGEAGYFVYTPLALEGCDCAALVNRGWVSLGANRQAIPAVALASAAVALRGTAAAPPSAGVGMTAEAPEQMAPGLLRVQRVDMSALSRRLGTRLLPLTIRLDPDEPDGYLRNWASPPSRAERHTAYAVQWFLLAALALGVTIGGAVKRRQR